MTLFPTVKSRSLTFFFLNGSPVSFIWKLQSRYHKIPLYDRTQEVLERTYCLLSFHYNLHTARRKTTLVCMHNEVSNRIQDGKLHSWYYRLESFMKIPISNVSDGIIYIPNFMKIGLAILVIFVSSVQHWYGLRWNDMHNSSQEDEL
jgi:hypothetical protein